MKKLDIDFQTIYLIRFFYQIYPLTTSFYIHVKVLSNEIFLTTLTENMTNFLACLLYPEGVAL